MNADTTPTIGWAAVCFLPLLLLGVSAVILLVVLLRKRATRPRRRTLGQWSNPNGNWWFVAAGVAVAVLVGGVLFLLPAGSVATLKPKSHIVNGEELLVEPPGPFDGGASVVLFPIVAGVVALGIIGLTVVGVVRGLSKTQRKAAAAKSAPPVALPVAPLILTPDPTPEGAPVSVRPTVKPPAPITPEKPKEPPTVAGEDYTVTQARHSLGQVVVYLVIVGMMAVLLAGIVGLVAYGQTSTPDQMIVPVMASLFAALIGLPVLAGGLITFGRWAITRWVYPLPKGVSAAAIKPVATPTAGDCPTCLNPIPPDSPHGLCPRCLIRGAMPSPSSTRLRRGVSPIAPPTPAEVNDFFPHLEVLELIGAGGMGAVYTARQPALDRVVALKIVQSPRGDDDPVFAERFAREARAMAKLDHPNIVTIHESGEAGGLPFLLMEYVDGVTLREAMANRLLTTIEALAVIPQVCDALDFAHRAGVVHRDIKPENILIDQTGRVKIADFGLAKLADPKNVTLTRTQQAMGTPHYMAPEQWEKPNDVDHRADIYALGVVLYELLTGELPLGRFALPSEKGKGDARLDQVVVKALAKDVGERFQSAGQMKAALSGVKLAAFTPAVPPKRKGFEFRSKRTFLGLPLVHVVAGWDPVSGKKRIARGWIAMGDVMAVGGVAVGGVAGFGLIGVGGAIGAGLIGVGGPLAVGLLAAIGGNAVALLFALGGNAASLGLSIGGQAFGKFAVGGQAGGEYVISASQHTPGFGDALAAWVRGFWPW